MARGDKNKYSDKQKRQAEHIEEVYETRGTPRDKSERIAWATVNKIYGGGKKGGSATKKKSENKVPYKRGGRKGGLH